MTISYEARLLRQTRNYYVYAYSMNEQGTPFTVYLPKTDFAEQPPKVAKLSLEAA